MSSWSYILLFLLCLGFGEDSDSLYYNLKMVFYLLLDFSRRFFLGNLETEICLFVRFGGSSGGTQLLTKGPMTVGPWARQPRSPRVCGEVAATEPSTCLPTAATESGLGLSTAWQSPRSRGLLSFCRAELPPRRLGAAAGIKVQSRGPGQGVNILGSFSLRLSFVFDRCILHLEQHLAQRRIKYLPFHRVLLITCYIEARSPHALCSMRRLVQGFHK